MLLLIFLRFNALGAAFYSAAPTSLWLVAASWFFAPALMNPFGFTLAGVKQDQQEWSAWLHSEDFDAFFYGQKAGTTTGELNQNNWFSWLNAEPTHLKLIHAIARLSIYGVITLLILQRVVYVPTIEVDALRWADGTLQAITVIALSALLLYAARVDSGLLRAVACYALIVLVLLAVLVLSNWSISATLWSLCLLLYALGKALLAALELALIVI